ncbi:hypothetical protein ZYGR_0BA00470 [Zygosaccharomyces rouxii]|uniref:AMP-dependent synthetase/ligase domain-containing protein n=1 Tax=Zygosaccharomyces rouxii TaxID=4956 RepID=A0A1Q3AKA7_ZYGRO|nr:hypothetical protein ZYGR_0BA00470 [Zygosaccharomyces rouxii]
MDWLSLIKTIATVIAVLLTTNWLFRIFYLDLKRDFSELAAEEQSNITTTRKENETALYRNFSLPLGFPLVTGLGLSLKYKIRNGNFADIWSAIMDLADKNSIRFVDGPRDLSLQEINGMAKHILEKYLSNAHGNVGILVTPSKSQGFIISIASMMASVKYNTLPHFLTSLPRKKSEDIDILVIDSWKSFAKLRGSENWYGLIIVCESKTSGILDHPENVISWDQLIHGYKNDNLYVYSPPDDNSDDHKILLYFTSPHGATTSFSQGCLVSGVASFIRSFPLDHELTAKDSLAVAGNMNSLNLSLQVWQKALAVLLHGGKISFQETLDLSNINNPTLLLADSNELLIAVKKLVLSNGSFIQRLKYQWATALLTEGVFTAVGQLPIRSIDNLRCVYVLEQVSDSSLVTSFPKTVPKLKRGQSTDVLDSLHLNYLRAHLGSRVIFEYHCPHNVMGPIAHTNFYDYRVLPPRVSANFIFCGPISTSLEGKLVNTEQNCELDVAKRQGMLCIRGFTIGKPVEPARLEKARELSGEFGGGEGWMPMVGIFGLWGQDGCLYVYK